MSEIDAFVNAVESGVRTIERRDSKPDTVLYDTREPWFSEDPVRLSEVMTEGILSGMNGIDTDVGDRVVVLSEDVEEAVSVRLHKPEQ